MRNHRTRDRRGPFRSGVLGCVSGFSVTFQNNRFGWIDIVPDESLTVTWLPELDAATRNGASSVREVQCRADRSRPGGIVAYSPGISPSSARRHDRAETGFAPTRLPNHDRSERTTFGDRAGRVLRLPAFPHTPLLHARPLSRLSSFPKLRLSGKRIEESYRTKRVTFPTPPRRTSLCGLTEEGGMRSQELFEKLFAAE